MDTIKIPAGACKMVAHRGVSGLEKENTMAAFVAAGNRSYFGVETDIHRTLDGQYVAIHDDKTGRVAKENKKIAESTLAELRAICLDDIADGPARADLRIPTLEEYIRACKRYAKVCVLELKDDFSSEQLGEIVECIRAADYLDSVIFIAFGLENLIRLRKIVPGQPAQYLTGNVDQAVIDALVANHLDLDVHYSALDEDVIRMLHGLGVKVNCWTVDSAADAQQLIAFGVDFITSNILEGA